MKRWDICDKHDSFFKEAVLLQILKSCLLNSLIILQGLVFIQLIYLETLFLFL